MVCPTSIFKVNFSHVQVIDYQSFEDDIESISDYSVVPLMLYNLASLEDEAGLNQDIAHRPYKETTLRIDGCAVTSIILVYGYWHIIRSNRAKK